MKTRIKVLTNAKLLWQLYVFHLAEERKKRKIFVLEILGLFSC